MDFRHGLIGALFFSGFPAKAQTAAKADLSRLQAADISYSQRIQARDQVVKGGRTAAAGVWAALEGAIKTYNANRGVWVYGGNQERRAAEEIIISCIHIIADFALPGSQTVGAK